eukprot:2265471-Prymnesium_polylepis.2
MGCASSRILPPTTIVDPQTAEEVYGVADRPRPEHMMATGPGRNPVESDVDRGSMIGPIFDTCDPNSSGYLDLERFSKLFDNSNVGEDDDAATRLFLLIDSTDDADGKITKKEFVKWCVTPYHAARSLLASQGTFPSAIPSCDSLACLRLWPSGTKENLHL